MRRTIGTSSIMIDYLSYSVKLDSDVIGAEWRIVSGGE